MKKISFLILTLLILVGISGCLTNKQEEKVVVVQKNEIIQKTREPIRNMTLTQLVKMMAEKEALKAKSKISRRSMWVNIIDEGVYLKTTSGAIHYYTYSSLIKMSPAKWSEFWDKVGIASNETTTSSYITVGEVGVPIKSYIARGVYDEVYDGLAVTTSAFAVRPNTLVKKIDSNGNITETMSACSTLQKIVTTTAITGMDGLPISINVTTGTTTAALLAKLPTQGIARLSFGEMTQGPVNIDWNESVSQLSTVTTGAYIVYGKVTPTTQYEYYSNIDNVTASAIVNVFTNKAASPVLSAPILFSTTTNIAITITSGQTLKYTLDGTDPSKAVNSTNSSIILAISGPTHVKAIAYNADMCPSDIVEELYTNNYVVQNTNDSGAGSLRAGIESIADTISFSDTIKTDINISSELWIYRNVKIVGNSDNKVVISGQNSSNIFHVTSGALEIENIVLTKAYGVAIAVNGLGGNLTVNNCEFINNGAGGNSGAGINISGYSANTLLVQNSYFASNNAQHGGAISSSNPYSDVNINYCTFENNVALYTGGAIEFSDTGTVTLNGNLFNHNEAKTSGGALCVTSSYRSNVRIKNSTFAYNFTDVDGNGGGIYYTEYSGSGSFNILNCTFVKNTAYQGGGIYNSMINGGILQMQNSIVAENTASFGSDISGKLFAEYSLIKDITGWNGINSSIFWSGISPQLNEVKDINNKLLYFQPYDYSFVINKGYSSYNTDYYDGIYGHSRIIGNNVDIGAVEAEYDTISPSTPILTTNGTISTTMATFTIHGNAEPNSTIVMSVSGIAIGYTRASQNGDFAIYNSSELNNGNYNIEITSEDSFGNVSSSTSIIVEEAVKLLTPILNPNGTNSLKFSAEDGTTIVYTTDGTAPDYNSPNRVSPGSVINIYQTTIYKFIAIKNGRIDSDMGTYTAAFAN